jgi:hypothetical protein
MCSTGSYIFVSNHQSVFDIPIIGALLRSNFPKYVSKRELARCRPLSQSHPPSGIAPGSLAAPYADGGHPLRAPAKVLRS